ncbi:hypothetical protein [Methanoculleus chikugoensis]|uniref:hypothetical protein n=1 Tax=Methanoculleus chikugoensis TaxID=118126 RepID=UPI0006D13FD9|nr:hypothetical protein [Methanoculleus chikugoensis]
MSFSVLQSRTIDCATQYGRSLPPEEELKPRPPGRVGSELDPLRVRDGRGEVLAESGEEVRNLRVLSVPDLYLDADGIPPVVELVVHRCRPPFAVYPDVLHSGRMRREYRQLHLRELLDDRSKP